MTERHLDGTKQGEVHYDFDNDVLSFRVKEREYDYSEELHNFVLDIDKEQFVTGIRIFDASRVFGMDKLALRDIPHWSLQSRIENGVITVEFKFIARRRNKLQYQETPVTQRISERVEGLPDALVTVAA